MFEKLPQPAPDGILQIMQLYREDPRSEKIDLGVGVYKDASGATPIMRAVKAAEKKLWEQETTKSYVGLTGAPDFADAMVALVLGDAVPRGKVAAAATPGGTGAVRQAFELGQLANPDLRVFVSDPTWPNHVSILNHLGIPVVPYRYFDAASRGVDFAGMLEDLAGAKPGDLVLLHGCCHNPTGANLSADQWAEVIAVLAKTGATPMIDIAYQGFGDGLESDSAATRRVAAELPECLIAASCSKNFGIYRERTGILMATGSDTARNQANLAYLNRQNFSFPPDHGARLVTMILNDPELRADWEAELEEMRTGMLALRQSLADELKRLSNSDRFSFLAEHRGMFSRLGASGDQVKALRADHGVYIVGDSRINIAGLNDTTVPKLAQAIIAAGI